MKLCKIFIFCFLAMLSAYGQKDSIVNSLDEVIVIADKNIKENSIGFKKINLQDSIILNNSESFTSLLRFNAPIYFREYGSGGTSSARFRGTSSSNTAVIWNGININSVNGGQTGFNSLTVNLVDNIDIRPGGGSIKYGSGAIGGTIHLNTDLQFKKHFTNQFISSIGSYETYKNVYKFSYGSSSFVMKGGISRNESENDYPLLGTEFVNTNGSYKNLEWNFNTAFKFSNNSKISFYTTKYNATRYFSGQLPNPKAAKEKYRDFNQRNLLVFEIKRNNFTHITKAAFLTQEYNYFADKNIDTYDFGKSKTYLLNYDFFWQINASSKLETYTEYTSIFGSTKQIEEKNRIQFSQAAIFTKNFQNNISYNLKFRKDFNSDFEVPFVFAFGAEIPLENNWKIRMNASNNYRVPTYNDLYWPGQGNLDLIPETSKQAEIGINWSTKRGNSSYTNVDIGYFYIDSKEKIVWTPGGDPDRNGIWVPINISEVLNKGFEIRLSQKYRLDHHIFTLSSNYSYTNATDKQTDKYLIFVPKHLINANFAYSYKKWNFFYQFLFNGKIYSSEDNFFSLPSFDISNIGLNYKIFNNKNQSLAVALKVNNIYNEIYQNSPSRIMPNRNFNTTINYKF